MNDGGADSYYWDLVEACQICNSEIRPWKYGRLSDSGSVVVFRKRNIIVK